MIMNQTLIKKYNNKDINFLLTKFLVFYVKKNIWDITIDENELLIIKEFILSNGYDNNIYNYINLNDIVESLVENNTINENLPENNLTSYLSNFINKNNINEFNLNDYKLEIEDYSLDLIKEKIEIYLKMKHIPHHSNSIHIQKVNLLTELYKKRGGLIFDIIKDNKCHIM